MGNAILPFCQSVQKRHHVGTGMIHQDSNAQGHYPGDFVGGEVGRAIGCSGDHYSVIVIG